MRERWGSEASTKAYIDSRPLHLQLGCRNFVPPIVRQFETGGHCWERWHLHPEAPGWGLEFVPGGWQSRKTFLCDEPHLRFAEVSFPFRPCVVPFVHPQVLEWRSLEIESLSLTKPGHQPRNKTPTRQRRGPSRAPLLCLRLPGPEHRRSEPACAAPQMG